MSLVPFDDRDGWIWMDGQLVPWREAKVHVLTHALHYASCVFEGERNSRSVCSVSLKISPSYIRSPSNTQDA